MRPAAFEEAATEDLLHLMEDYGLVRAIVKETCPFAGNSLPECRLTEKGLVILVIERGRDWIPIPKAKEEIEKGDRLVVYGPLDTLKALFREDSSV